MKYNDKPSVDFARAKSMVFDIIKEQRALGIKTDEELMGIIFDKLNDYFSKVGKIYMDEKYLPKNGDYPRSEVYNATTESLVKDIVEIFTELSQLGLELTKTENFIEAQRQIVDNLRQISKDKVYNSELASVSNESFEYWSTESFNSDEGVNFDQGRTSSRSMLDTREGVITLEPVKSTQVQIKSAKWNLNMRETKITTGYTTKVADDIGKDYLNIYGGQRYGIDDLSVPDTVKSIRPGEPWTDNPLATLQNVKTAIGSESFSDDLRSELEMVLCEKSRFTKVVSYVLRHLIKFFNAQNYRAIDWRLVHNGEEIWNISNSVDSPYYKFSAPINHVKMVADMNLTLNNPSAISHVHTIRSVMEGNKHGACRLTGITIYDGGGVPLSRSDVKINDNQITTKTFNSSVETQNIKIRVERDTNNIVNEYLPYSVLIIPMKATVSKGTVKATYKKYIIQEASVPRTVYYRASDNSVAVGV